MAKKKVSRKELLRGPDEFLSFSARSVIYIQEHVRQFKLAGAVLLGGILIYAGIHTYLGYVDKKAQRAYSTAYQSMLKVVTQETGLQDLDPTLSLFQKVEEDYGLADLSDLALPQMAYLKFTQRKYDEAVALYEDFLGQMADHEAYRSLARLAMAACYEAKEDYTKAAGVLDQLANAQGGVFREQAMLSLARVFRLADQPAKAAAVLEKFIETFPSSPFAPLARAHLEKSPR